MCSSDLSGGFDCSLNPLYSPGVPQHLHQHFWTSSLGNGETCLTYLNLRTIKDISSTLIDLSQSTPFLKYSSLYWGFHARRETSSCVISLALQLFSQIETPISTKLLLKDEQILSFILHCDCRRLELRNIIRPCRQWNRKKKEYY